jgi:excisionase family DNA binding protein
METLTIEQAADKLNIERTYALKLAGLGILPGAKIGKAWVFLEDDLTEYLRNEVRRQQLLRQSQSSAELPEVEARIASPRKPGRPRQSALPKLDVGSTQLRIS